MESRHLGLEPEATAGSERPPAPKAAMVSEDACAGLRAGGSVSLPPHLLGRPVLSLHSALTSYPPRDREGMEMEGWRRRGLSRGRWEGVQRLGSNLRGSGGPQVELETGLRGVVCGVAKVGCGRPVEPRGRE